MRLYEFEAKQILKGEEIKVPNSQLITCREQIDRCDSLIPGIVKVQTLGGRRQKMGGVQTVNDLQSVRKLAERFLGQKFGQEIVQHILLEDQIRFECELFLGISYDSGAKRPVMLLSEAGGVHLEETATAGRHRIHRLVLNPGKALRPSHANEWLAALGFAGSSLGNLADILEKMVALFLKYDSVLLEINPLAKFTSGEFVALDCHMEVDDDAMPRLSLTNIIRLPDRRRGSRKLTKFEQKAREIHEMDHRGVTGRLVEFPGNLGLLIGGGGASLTIFDAIKDRGGKPANYCEMGGNPTVTKVKELTKLLLSQPKVQKLAVIMNVVNNTRADLIAQGVIKGIYEAGRDPRKTIVVFRLPGSGEDKCKELLDDHGVPFSGRELSIDEAAALAVERSDQ